MCSLGEESAVREGLSVVPCKTNEAIEKVLPTKLFKLSKCSNLLLP